MGSIERNNMNPENGQSIAVTDQERKLIEILREIDEGEASIKVQNSLLVMVEVITKDYNYI